MSDLHSQYAATIRSALQGAPSPGLTIPELQRATKLSERLVRIGVGILVGMGHATESRKMTPGLRGAMPLAYELKA